jgi:hypothetical protein
MKAWFEKFNVMIELEKNAWPIIRLITVISGAMMLTFMFVNAGKKDEMDTYIAQYNEFKSDAEKANAMVDELRVQVAEKEHEAQAAQSRAAYLNTQVRERKQSVSGAISVKDSLLKTITDSIEMARVIIPEQEKIIESQIVIIKTQDEQVHELNTVITLQKESNQLLTFAVDSLQKVIINIPAAPKNPNKMFGISLPTRKQSLIGGIVIGVVTTFVILK